MADNETVTPEVPAAPKGKGKVHMKGTAKCKVAHRKPLSSYRDKNGKKLPKFIEYDFEWDQWADEDSLVAGHDQLTLKEQLKVRQVEAKTTARQAANTALLLALGIVKPNEETSVEVRLMKVYDGLYGKRVANMPKDLTEEQKTEYLRNAHIECRKKAAEALEEDWPTSDEDEDDEE